MTSRLRAVRLAAAVMALVATAAAQRTTPAPSAVQFVFTSDAHYGLTRPIFRGAVNVDAHVVNAALVAQINALPKIRFPNDGGVRAGELIGALDFVAEGGDIVNREETADGPRIQPAAVSWRQFVADYVDGLHVTNSRGEPTPVLMVPGNHDVSNAVGFYKPMTPPIDKTALVGIFNRMLMPAVPKTTSTYDYFMARVFFTRDFGGVHFVFVSVWPDSDMRARIDRDLAHLPQTTPVVLVTHDQPDAESKHFRNPNGAHNINAHDRFENLLADTFADGRFVDAPALAEHRALESFLRLHPQIQAYFHGNSNWNEFYDWTGPNHTVALHTFRVDSPMKGAISVADETRLSFHVVTIGPSGRMTAREFLWNADRAHPQPNVKWGASTTVRVFATKT
jgi:calcineurin-like phosphoesterase family protein